MLKLASILPGKFAAVYPCSSLPEPDESEKVAAGNYHWKALFHFVTQTALKAGEMVKDKARNTP